MSIRFIEDDQKIVFQKFNTLKENNPNHLGFVQKVIEAVYDEHGRKLRDVLVLIGPSKSKL